MEINKQSLSELVSLKDPNKIVVAICYYFYLVITYNNQEYFDGSMNDVWGINKKQLWSESNLSMYIICI